CSRASVSRWGCIWRRRSARCDGSHPDAADPRGPVSSAHEYDVVVIGAGHNGLAATALLAARGLRVLCLEKNAYVGGMAGTREILTGCRNDVGGSLLFPLAKGAGKGRGVGRCG